MRLHYNEDGTTEQTILEDLDDDPNTITIKTDKFSTYAFAYKTATPIVKSILILIGILVLFALMFVLLLKALKRSMLKKK